MGLLLAVLVGIASVMIWKTLHPKTLPENLLQGTGRMDGDLINLNTKYPGRLETITVEDGIRDAQESRGLGDVYKRQI